MKIDGYPDQGQSAPEDMDDMIVDHPDEQEQNSYTDPDTGALVTEGDDGSVTVDFNHKPQIKEKSSNFDKNLAEDMDEKDLDDLATMLLEGIDADIQSRSLWIANQKEIMTMLGLEREMRSGLDLDTVSKCRHPIVLQAVMDFWANFIGEFLPADGPCKVTADDDQMPDADNQAERLERDINHWLKEVATEYYPDTSRAGFRIGLSGGIVKKVYYDATRQRPVSEAIYLEDLIVSNDTTDLDNAHRVTHRMLYLPDQVKSMQAAGVWLEVDLQTPQGDVSELKKKASQIDGIDPNPTLDRDRQHTIFECHTKLVIQQDKLKNKLAKDFEGIDSEDTRDDDPNCLSVPYKVTVERDSRKILAIYRLWKEDDKLFRKKQQFVPWFYAPGLGWYPIGIGQLLMNDASTLTALWREMVDAGMFANFPGFLYLDSLGRQDTNRIRVPPGGGQGIKGIPNMPIANQIMPLPYKGVDPTLLAFAKEIEQGAQSKVMSAKIPIGEGKADIPVGTLVMTIEQASKQMQAIHKGLHFSQKREFELLKELFAEDPEALTRFDKDPNKKPWTTEELENLSLAPASDPNVPSHIHRLMQNLALVQMAQQAPQLFNLKEVATRVLKTMHIPDIDQLWAPPAPPTPPPPDPKLQLEQMKFQADQEETQRKAASEALESQQRDKESQMNAQLEAAKIAQQQRQSDNEIMLEKMRLQQQQDKNTADSMLKLHDQVTKNSIPQMPGTSQ